MADVKTATLLFCLDLVSAIITFALKFGLLKEGKPPHPRTVKITITSAGFLFIALWAARAYAIFRS